MTQPIQEPGPSTRTDSKLTWGTNQLFRRPAPISTQGLPYCWMRWVGSEAVPADTLFDPVSGPTPDVPYEEACVYDPTNLAGFDPDIASGCLSWSNAGEYYVWASVEWNGTSSTGQTLGAIISLGSFCSFSTNRVVNTIIADTINQNMQIPVDRMIVTLADDSVSVLVYHTVAAGNDLGAVWLHAVQISPIPGDCIT